jgi:hypothetical protein
MTDAQGGGGGGARQGGGRSEIQKFIVSSEGTPLSFTATLNDSNFGYVLSNADQTSWTCITPRNPSTYNQGWTTSSLDSGGIWTFTAPSIVSPDGRSWNENAETYWAPQTASGLQYCQLKYAYDPDLGWQYVAMPGDFGGSTVSVTYGDVIALIGTGSTISMTINGATFYSNASYTITPGDFAIYGGYYSNGDPIPNIASQQIAVSAFTLPSGSPQYTAIVTAGGGGGAMEGNYGGLGGNAHYTGTSGSGQPLDDYFGIFPGTGGSAIKGGLGGQSKNADGSNMGSLGIRRYGGVGYDQGTYYSGSGGGGGGYYGGGGSLGAGGAGAGGSFNDSNYVFDFDGSNADSDNAIASNIRGYIYPLGTGGHYLTFGNFVGHNGLVLFYV